VNVRDQIIFGQSALYDCHMLLYLTEQTEQCRSSPVKQGCLYLGHFTSWQLALCWWLLD